MPCLTLVKEANRIMCQCDDCYHKEECVKLDVVGNNGGYMIRFNDGQLAVNDLESRLVSLPHSPATKITYHIDVVVHSMGFAYAQGLINNLRQYSTLRDKIKWGGYYIIAPENGCADSVDPASFEEVWQYGSNLGQANADPLWEQDGVAPQCPVGNINNGNPSRSGRAFIPAVYGNAQPIPKGYKESHAISNYGWVFERTVTQPGYVTPK